MWDVISLELGFGGGGFVAVTIGFRGGGLVFALLINRGMLSWSKRCRLGESSLLS
jgi:predicted esterase